MAQNVRLYLEYESRLHENKIKLKTQESNNESLLIASHLSVRDNRALISVAM